MKISAGNAGNNGYRIKSEGSPDQVVRDMQRLFGGTIGENSNGIFMDTDDGSLSANMNQAGTTIVRIRNLEERESAQRWLTFQTYRSAAGISIAAAAIEAQRHELSPLPVMSGRMWLTQTFATEAFSRDGMENIRLHAIGEDLHDTVINMIEGHREIALQESDIDPDTVILDALGIPGMSEFSHAWEGGPSQPEPLPYSAARLMLDSLVQRPFAD